MSSKGFYSKPKAPSIRLSEFLKNYQDALKNYRPNEDFSLESKLELQYSNKEDLEEIESVCSLAKNLAPSTVESKKYNEASDLPLMRTRYIKRTPKADSLQTCKRLKQKKTDLKAGLFHRTQEGFKALPLPLAPTPQEPTNLCNFYNDLIITIRMYRPMRAIKFGNSLEKPVFANEFRCLGSNLLSEFRDKIDCICNKKHFFDVSENLEQKVPLKTTDPGFFFITDTFYDDYRNPKNAIYSQPIIDWAKNSQGLHLKQFKTAKMEETNFINIDIHMGHPQLYLHHGNCEHVFVFAQLEVLTPASPCTYKMQYPYPRSYNLYNNRTCHLCSKRLYNYIVENSALLLTDPSYLCSECIRNYLYLDGKKVGTFKAYRIHDDVMDQNEENSIGSETHEQEQNKAQDQAREQEEERELQETVAMLIEEEQPVKNEKDTTAKNTEKQEIIDAENSTEQKDMDEKESDTAMHISDELASSWSITEITIKEEGKKNNQNDEDEVAEAEAKELEFVKEAVGEVKEENDKDKNDSEMILAVESE